MNERVTNLEFHPFLKLQEVDKNNIVYVIFAFITNHTSLSRSSSSGSPKIGSTMSLIHFFYIRMLKNKAQIARESIKRTLELSGPFSGPWTPAKSEFGSAFVMCVLAHNLLRPPINENPGSAPAELYGSGCACVFEFGLSAILFGIFFIISIIHVYKSQSLCMEHFV